MIPQTPSEIENLVQGKLRRLKLTDSLHDFFALNPKYFNKRSDNDKPELTGGGTKSVHFADDSDNCSNIYHDFSASTRSLTSIAEETIDLDHTQHSRRPTSDSRQLDTTDHRRKDFPYVD